MVARTTEDLAPVQMLLKTGGNICHDGRRNFIYDELLTTVMPFEFAGEVFDFPIEGGIGSHFVTSCCVSS